MEKYRRFPLTIAGDFYVVDGMCMACTAPEHEAPDLMNHDPGIYRCYFHRQPQTPEESERAVMAVAVGCCGAVRYGGSDPTIMLRLEQLGCPESCDQRG